MKTMNNFADWYSFFRIFLPALLLLKLASFAPDISALWLKNGYIQADITDISYGRSWVWSITQLTEEMNALSFLGNIDFNTTVIGCVLLYVLFLIFLLFGLMTKISNIIVLLLHLTLQTSFYTYSYGVDNFITILLFYLLITKIPRKSTSLDHKFFGSSIFNFGLSPQVVIRMMQMHLCIAYCFSGLEKGLGYNWWNGESIWRALHSNFGLIDMAFIDGIQYKWIFIVAGWATIVAEFLYPIFVSFRKTKIFWVSGVILMHLSIIICLGLYHFGIIMIFFNLLAFIVPELVIENEKSSNIRENSNLNFTKLRTNISSLLIYKN